MFKVRDCIGNRNITLKGIIEGVVLYRSMILIFQAIMRKILKL